MLWATFASSQNEFRVLSTDFGTDYYIAFMLGRSWLGMRGEDVMVSARWLRDKHDTKSIRLVAIGDVGPPALHAAALEPELVANLELKESLESWRELMRAKDAHKHIYNAVHDALRYYDLPDLVQMPGGNIVHK